MEFEITKENQSMHFTIKDDKSSVSCIDGFDAVYLDGYLFDIEDTVGVERVLAMLIRAVVVGNSIKQTISKKEE